MLYLLFSFPHPHRSDQLTVAITVCRWTSVKIHVTQLPTGYCHFLRTLVHSYPLSQEINGSHERLCSFFIFRISKCTQLQYCLHLP